MADEKKEILKSPQAGMGLLLGVLGIVYGDIGTSPLYSLRICFTIKGAAPVTPANVIGILSLIFWALFILIAVKYCMFVLRADNKGEGGILALMTQSMKNTKKPSSILLIVGLGLFGSALLYGDSLITPVISVLSAVEGLNIISPFFIKAVVPISLVILVGLFYFQHLGTGRIGSVFGPIMLVWFSSIAIMGTVSLIRTPEVLTALNPFHALHFIRHNPLPSFLMLGGVFLTLTGGEAMYADMGHFGKSPIRKGWFLVVFPALILNYFGQGAQLIRSPGSLDGLFYRLVPHWFVLPMVVLATAATIIASQAVISGAFSLARQSVQLGYLPRLEIVHTSSETQGQIYVPLVNILLLTGTVLLTLIFKNSDSLAAAYGVAVSATMLITSVLLYRIARSEWHWSRIGAAILVSFFLVFDIFFFVSNLTKITTGGYLPLLIAIGIFYIMVTWSRERKKMYGIISKEALNEEYLFAEIRKNKPYRPDGVGVYLSGNPSGVPRTVLHNYKHNKVIHKTVVFLTVISKEVPLVEPQDRISVRVLGLGFFRISISYGFMEKMDVPAALRTITQEGLNVDPLKVTFFLSKENMIVLKRPFFRNIPRVIYAFLSRNSRDASSFYNLPPNRVIELGIQMEI
jgi:KUP system potassium uptake protein